MDMHDKFEDYLYLIEKKENIKKYYKQIDQKIYIPDNVNYNYHDLENMNNQFILDQDFNLDIDI